MKRRPPPECPTCRRRHWELVATEMAARHCHMSGERFRKALASGLGPRPWAHEIHAYPRYHVDELDRWLADTSKASAA